jgi:nitrite reductase/ring-hydroxylating ferredoxin subunit
MPAHKIALVKDLREHRGKMFALNGEAIAVFNINGDFYAVSNVCPHQHFSKLHEGILKELTITCPMHGWTYDLATGRSTNAGGVLKTFRTEIRGNDLYLHTNEESD